MYRICVSTCSVLALVVVAGCDATLQTPDQLGLSTVTFGPTCAGDDRPDLSWDGIADGGVIGEGAPLLLKVTDDHDQPSALTLSWSSTVDGPQDGAPLQADSEGRVEIPLTALTLGDQGITVEAVDSCGNRALLTLGACLQGVVHTPELPLDALLLTGDASIDPATGALDLTQDVGSQVGTSFDDRATVRGDELHVVASFMLATSDRPGDGFSFTALDANRRTGWRGGVGCAMGYGTAWDCQTGSPLPGWSVEVDTWTNDHDPIDGPHVAFVFDGQMDAPVAWAPIDDPVDGAWHELTIDVSGGLVVVGLDGQTLIQVFPDASRLAFPAYVGFTGATGLGTQQQRIRSVDLTHLACGG